MKENVSHNIYISLVISLWLQEHVYCPCVPEGISHCSISETETKGFSPWFGVIMNLERFDVLFDNKLSILRLYLWFYCFLFCLFFGENGLVG